MSVEPPPPQEQGPIPVPAKGTRPQLVECHICSRSTYNWSHYTIRFATGPDHDIEVCWQCEISLGEEE